MKPKYLEIEEFKRVKTFMFSMNLFDLTLKQKQAFLTDKRLTLVEKEIVKATISLKDCLYTEIIQKLSTLQGQNELVESQRRLILGMAYSASGDCQKAKTELENSYSVFARFHLKSYEFYSLLQLFFVHYNLKSEKKLAWVLDQMKDLEIDNEKNVISYLRCQFNYFNFIGNASKARLVLAKLEAKIPEMHSSQIIPHLIDRFVYELKIDDFNGCEKTLDEMKDFRRFNYSANYKFMKTMFNHFRHKKPIYLYDKDFSDCPLLLYQLKTIKALESGDKTQAQLYWKSLSEMNSEVYQENFEYKGDKCLFSLCLDLYMKPKQINFQFEDSMSLEDKLIHILKVANGPVKKEELYELLWQTPMESKDDLAKLSMMVSRVKKKSGLVIQSRKGCYVA